jgi:hypothetical protein
VTPCNTSRVAGRSTPCAERLWFENQLSLDIEAQAPRRIRLRDASVTNSVQAMQVREPPQRLRSTVS